MTMNKERTKIVWEAKGSRGYEREYTIHLWKDDEGWGGSFEVDGSPCGQHDVYFEGELLFQGKTLIDYDGVYELPKPIEKKLIEMGFESYL